MVTFRCKRSGNTISFSNENDIAGLRAHEGYDEVKDEIKTHAERSSESIIDCSIEGKDGDGKKHEDDVNEKIVKKEVLKKRGRPLKK